MSDYTIRDTCRLCDSRDLTEVLNLGQTPLANSLDSTELFPLVVMRCGACGHHQLSIAVHPDKLWGPGYVYQSGTSPVFRKHLEALADEVAALKPGGRVLEIASNDGTLVKMLADRDLRASGIDPSGPEGNGSNCYYLERASWPPASRSVGAFDIILALNVFAHVDDLHSFTAAVKEALAPDGVFIVEVGSFMAVAHRGHFDTIYHEHMSYHTLEPLHRFFMKHGLGIDYAENVESQGGSMRVYVKHESQARMFGVHSCDPDVDNLSLTMRGRGQALREALNKLFHRGEMVCIYGAPAKLTTLLYATGLQDMPFNCVFDDNPRKIGRTTPGMHLPIVSSEELMQRNPDTLVVSSWNFFEDIKQKVRAMGFKGGLINPMGEL